MKWPIFFCCIWQITSSSYALHVLKHLKLKLSYKKFGHAWLIIVMRYHRYHDKKLLSDAALLHLCHIPLGHCGVFWALWLLWALVHTQQWRAPVQQRFDRVKLIDVCSFGSLFLRCVISVMWHVIAWKKVKTGKGKFTGLVYSQEVVCGSGRIGKQDL